MIPQLTVSKFSQAEHYKRSYYSTHLLLIFIVLFALVSTVAICSISDQSTDGSIYERLYDRGDLTFFTTTEAELTKLVSDFQPWVKDKPMPAAVNAEYLWIKIRLDNPTDKDFRAILEIDKRWTDEASFYTKKDGDSYKEWKTGRAIPSEKKPLLSHLPVFPVHVSPHSQGVYLLRLKNTGDVSPDSLRLWEDELAFWEYSNNEQYLFSIYSGTLCALATFLFVSFYVIQKKDVLYYTGYVLTTGFCLLVIFNMQGSMFLLDRLDAAKLAGLYFPAKSLAVAFFVFFALEFLEIEEALPKMDRWLRYGVKALLLICALTYVFGWDINAQVIVCIGLPLILMGFLVALYRIKQGYRLGIYLVLAYFVVSMTSASAVWSIVLENEEPTSTELRQLLLGFNIGIIILAVAWGDRFLNLRHEQELAQERALREEEKKVTLQKRYQSELKATVCKRSEELKEINAQKDRLFAIISHDLRTPINNMTALTNMMLHNPHAFDADALAKYANEIRSTGKQLLTLLDNLLQWAQVQTNELILDTRTYCLWEILAPGLEGYRSYAQNKKIRFDVNINPEIRVLTDSQITNTVIRNLLSNAIKYTPEGGSVALSAEDRGDFVCIQVSDTGVGLTREEIHEINAGKSFESKHSLESTLSAGFGLVLCQKLLKLQDVKLEVRSEKNLGSTFSFEVKQVV